MNNKNLKITVYCASSATIHQDFFRHAKKLGELLSKINCNVTYGGGATGLMGALADSMLEHGGNIRGLIPEFMVKKEWQHPDIHDMKVVCTMHERKEQMLQNCDIAIALPGGCGTLEEFMEALTWRQLELFNGRLLILNTRNYYDSLLDLLHKAVDENFMRENDHEMWEVYDSPEKLVEFI